MYKLQIKWAHCCYASFIVLGQDSFMRYSQKKLVIFSVWICTQCHEENCFFLVKAVSPRYFIAVKTRQQEIPKHTYMYYSYITHQFFKIYFKRALGDRRLLPSYLYIYIYLSIYIFLADPGGPGVCALLCLYTSISIYLSIYFQRTPGDRGCVPYCWRQGRQ